MTQSEPYRLTGRIGPAGTLGMIVLQVDETIEQDFRRLFPSAAVALHVSRIRSGAELTADTIHAMAADLPVAAGLLPPSAEFDVIAYACTSGTSLIGADKVAELVSGQARTRHVTDPLTAATAAFAALGVKNVSILSPYEPQVAATLVEAFQARGISVPAALSFGEANEAAVARIDPDSIFDAALRAGAASGAEAVFISCTNLRTLDVIPRLEARLGMPVLSSNQVLAWHMRHLSGAQTATDSPGRLFDCP
ncbi:maleate cis-trans isomerase family protein [Pseudooceanicola sp. C21-150M6]|uniref:maleate cis-trans isomerase family protein n=1 Tax=Pseudooceanicola sp. C21-150M6 TaxID=3434355 RepID=UPI003D7FDAF0